MRMINAGILAGLVTLAAATAAASRDLGRNIPGPPIGADSAGMFFVTYPKASLRLNEQGVAHYRLGLDDEGLATSCTVTRSSGYRRLDQLTCAAAVQHAKFIPAANDKGHPVPTVYEGKVDWSLR